MTIGIAELTDNLFYLQPHFQPSMSNTHIVANVISYLDIKACSVWYHRLGHFSSNNFQTLHSILPNMSSIDNSCLTCPTTKLKRSPFLTHTDN